MLQERLADLHASGSFQAAHTASQQLQETLKLAAQASKQSSAYKVRNIAMPVTELLNALGFHM